MVQKQVQERFEDLANNSCYALCLVEYMNRYRKMGLTRPSQYFMLVIQGYANNWIDWDGTVTDPAAFLSYIDPKHKKYKVSWVKGANTTYATFPTFYSIDSKTCHFVLTSNSKVVWNSLSYSRNVAKGKAMSYRKIEEL